jgi:hypothetical protein
MYDHDCHCYVPIHPTGATRADFEGPEEGPITVVITDLRAIDAMGRGIVINRGKKKHASYRDAEEAAWATIAKMTGHTVEELKSGKFYNRPR